MFKFQFAGFNFREVQNVIDDGQQGITTGTNRFSVITLLRSQVSIEQQTGHANDGIHRGTDFMAHHRQEGTFGLVGRFSIRPRLLQSFHRFFAFSDITDIACEHRWPVQRNTGDGKLDGKLGPICT